MQSRHFANFYWDRIALCQRSSALRFFTTDESQPQSPPQPGFFRFATARAINQTTVMTTTTRAAMVWKVEDMVSANRILAQKPSARPPW